jgi:hypothetical protein
MSRTLSTIRPMPSPLGSNRENLYLKTTIIRGSQLGQDSSENIAGIHSAGLDPHNELEDILGKIFEHVEPGHRRRRTPAPPRGADKQGCGERLYGS